MENIGIETERVEYKKTTGELKEAITSIVAILNKHGSGELYFIEIFARHGRKKAKRKVEKIQNIKMMFWLMF